ncbi:fu domain containing protein [Stylonychia lemnae]|uniref:Fu domain containing protein n=1 Tax=Stylonychia lemnae TaxID=5949 RepID=A0A078B030_STYLE|nr:fu domain containing protein [Stylonychia lemnae]|eukprot:CDW87691.1 fu domain containing protein [Stylonychia lemnae]
MDTTMYSIRFKKTIDRPLDSYVNSYIRQYQISADRENCTKVPSTFPVRGPDGLHFSRETDSIRLENSNNMAFTQKFMIVIWFKSIDNTYIQSGQSKSGKIFANKRYDNFNDQVIAISQVHYQSYQEIRADFLLSQYWDLKSQYTQSVVMRVDTKMQGWQLLSVSFDSSASSTSKVYMRLRNAFEQKATEASFKDYIWNDILPMKRDIYLGSPCESYYRKGYSEGNLMTIGRLFIWKSFANILQSSDTVFDKYFFRQFGRPTPSCIGLIPCSFCTIQYPVPTSFNVDLTCSTEGADYGEIYLAKWEFDEDYNITQYIVDQSPHQRHIMKINLDQVDNDEPFRIYGQGYMFYNKATVYTTSAPPFQNFPQFTVELWVRRYKDQTIYNPSEYEAAIPITVVDKLNNGKVFFKLTLSDVRESVIYQFSDNSDQQTSFPGLFKFDKWHYVSCAFFRYDYEKSGSTKTYNVYGKLQVDDVVKYNDQGSSSPVYLWPDESFIKITNQRTIIYKSLRIFGYGRLKEEASKQISTSCEPLGNQAQCTLCPSSSRQCLSKCDQDKFGENCDPCHFFCGLCNGPFKDNCTMCSRNPAISNVIYSNTFGNCTCVSGKYYNETTDKCEDCHENCKECFGGNQSQCMSCATGKIYYPNTICVDNCSDPLVVNGTKTGFFIQTEMIGGVSQKICLKCHPYCSKCTGGMSSECQGCQNGYLLKESTCFDTCPLGYFANFPTSNCDLCDLDCKTCKGSTNKDCLICKNPALLQQNGACKVRCDEGFYGDANQVCQPCHPFCGTCTTKFSTDCGSCVAGYFLQPGSSECLSDCPLGYYGDTVTHACLLCHYSCKTCSGYGADTCTVCATGFLRQGSLCVTKCDDNQFVVDGVCKSCDPKCSTCYGYNDNECYTCAENTITLIGYFYFQNSCKGLCPDGYYQDNFSRECKKCNPRCETCISDTFCTKCIEGPYQLNNGECTFFTCLDNQYRAIKPQLSCYECDPSCLTCQGKSQFDCLSCRPKNMLVAQQCLTCSEQPGMMEPLDDTINGCIEICGDGFNYGSYQCDDGNIINGDGCSATCAIETGFNCTSGSKTTPSVCMDNRNPSPRISLVTMSNQILIEFDEEVQLQSQLDTTTLNVQIKGPQGSYKFEWRLLDQYKTTEPLQLIGIQLSIYQTLKGSENEQVVIQFSDPNVYKDATGNGMIVLPMYSFLNKFDYIDPETKAKLDSAGDTSMLATFGAVAINLAISLVFGGSISAMWTMVNTIQLISLLPLCNIKYPAITLLVFEKMLGSHGESTIIPNILYDQVVSRPGSAVQIEPALNSKFSDYGWKISNFIFLSGRKILMWTGIVIAYPFVWYMKKKYADKHKFCKVWVKGEQKFRYTLLLRGVIMSYVSMYLAFILGIFQMDLSTMENTLSAFMAIAFGVILTYLPILLMNVLQRNYEKIQSEKFMLSYSTIVKEVDLSHPIRYMYYPVFLLRRALFAISLVLFANRPSDQIIFMSFTAGVMIIYVVIIRPQKDKIMIALTALGEALLLFLHLFSSVFLDEDLPEEKANSYGWFIIILIGLYILSNWIIIVTITIQQLKQQFKKSKVDKEKQKLKQKEDMEYKRWKKKRQIKNRISRDQKRNLMIEAFDESNNLISQSQFTKNNNLNGDSNTNIAELIMQTQVQDNPNYNQQSENLGVFYSNNQSNLLSPKTSAQSPTIPKQFHLVCIYLKIIGKARIFGIKVVLTSIMVPTIKIDHHIQRIYQATRTLTPLKDHSSKVRIILNEYLLEPESQERPSSHQTFSTPNALQNNQINESSKINQINNDIGEESKDFNFEDGNSFRSILVSQAQQQLKNQASDQTLPMNDTEQKKPIINPFFGETVKVNQVDDEQEDDLDNFLAVRKPEKKKDIPIW